MLGYFTGFILATVLTMGVFAAGYGELTYELGRSGGEVLEKRLMLFSSSACFIVGVAWITLTLSGVGVD